SNQLSYAPKFLSANRLHCLAESIRSPVSPYVTLFSDGFQGSLRHSPTTATHPTRRSATQHFSIAHPLGRQGFLRRIRTDRHDRTPFRTRDLLAGAFAVQAGSQGTIHAPINNDLRLPIQPSLRRPPPRSGAHRR